MSELEKVPPAVPVSELGKRSDAVFEQIKKTHVLITRQGKEAGVLVHPIVWNRMVDYTAKCLSLVTRLAVKQSDCDQ